MSKSFRNELEQLLNKYNIEKSSDTPDYVLARYMSDSLRAFENAILERDRWRASKGGP